ncbi:MAG: AtpZ/AtpI family protein [Acidimicrobiales bacterium]|nr:AtpZ/AtpI family protein [Acidimicrobiales bacterium]
MDVSQRREVSQQMYRQAGGWELALSPVLFALIGYGLDRLFGTVPVITIVFAVLGLVGAVVRLYYGYDAEMKAHEESGSWRR